MNRTPFKKFCTGLIGITATLLIILNSGCQLNGPEGKDDKMEAQLHPVLIPKDTLLSCLSEAVNLIAAETCDSLSVLQIFQRRSDRYKIVLNPGKDYSSSDKEQMVISSSFQPESSSCNVLIHIPYPLEKLVLFSDLKNIFGNWVVGKPGTIPMPQPKIPLTSFMVASNMKDTVNVVVQSLDLPEAKANSIFTIEISK